MGDFTTATTDDAIGDFTSATTNVAISSCAVLVVVQIDQVTLCLWSSVNQQGLLWNVHYVTTTVTIQTNFQSAVIRSKRSSCCIREPSVCHVVSIREREDPGNENERFVCGGHYSSRLLPFGEFRLVFSVRLIYKVRRSRLRF